jgi:hypothetical protein
VRTPGLDSAFIHSPDSPPSLIYTRISVCEFQTFRLFRVPELLGKGLLSHSAGFIGSQVGADDFQKRSWIGFLRASSAQQIA